jgi:hypothetical protein
MDLTLSIDGSVDIARRVLRDGEDLTTAGKALGPYQTDIQARASAAGQLQAALNMLVWHPQRIEVERYVAQARAYIIDQRAIRAAREATPLH